MKWVQTKFRKILTSFIHSLECRPTVVLSSLPSFSFAGFFLVSLSVCACACVSILSIFFTIIVMSQIDSKTDSISEHDDEPSSWLSLSEATNTTVVSSDSSALSTTIDNDDTKSTTTLTSPSVTPHIEDISNDETTMRLISSVELPQLEQSGDRDISAFEPLEASPPPIVHGVALRTFPCFDTIPDDTKSVQSDSKHDDMLLEHMLGSSAPPHGDDVPSSLSELESDDVGAGAGAGAGTTAVDSLRVVWGKPGLDITSIGTDNSSPDVPSAKDVFVNAGISVRFSADMVPLTSIQNTKNADGTLPVHTDPPLPESKWRWIDTKCVQFTGMLSASTTYTVTIDPCSSQDGKHHLTQTITWSFSTRCIEALSYSVVTAYSYGVVHELHPPLHILFNQDVDPQVMLECIELRKSNLFSYGPPLPLKLRHDDAEDGKDTAPLNFQAQRAYPKSTLVKFALEDGTDLEPNTHYHLFVVGDLPSLEGPLSTPGNKAMPSKIKFQTYGPLEIVTCGDTASPLARFFATARFSNPLDAEQFSEDMVSISPQVDDFEAKLVHSGYYGNAHLGPNQISFYGTLRPRTKYRISFSSAIRDAHGQTLGRNQTRTVSVTKIDKQLVLLDRVAQVRRSDMNMYWSTYNQWSARYGGGDNATSQYMLTLDPLEEKPCITVASCNIRSYEITVTPAEPSQYSTYMSVVREFNKWNIIEKEDVFGGLFSRRKDPGPMPVFEGDTRIFENKVQEFEYDSFRLHSLDLSPYLTQGKYGHFVVTVDAQDREFSGTYMANSFWRPVRRHMWIQCTHLGISVSSVELAPGSVPHASARQRKRMSKLFKFSATAYCCDLLSRDSIPDVQLELLPDARIRNQLEHNPNVLEANKGSMEIKNTTDEHGVGQISAWLPRCRRHDPQHAGYVGHAGDSHDPKQFKSYGHHVLIASNGQDTAIVCLSDDVATIKMNAIWHIVFDRALYQPGEKARVTVLCRMRDDFSSAPPRLPPQTMRKLEWSLGSQYDDRFNINNKKLLRGKCVLNDEGRASWEFVVPKEAKMLGRVTLTVSLCTKSLDKPARSFSTTFLVHEFRRPEYQIDTRIAKTSTVPAVFGSSVDILTTAKYYDGSAMAESRVRWTASYVETPYQPASYTGFAFDDSERRYSQFNGRWGRGFFNSNNDNNAPKSVALLTNTDVLGESTVTVKLGQPLAAEKVQLPRSVSVSAFVQDADFQERLGTTSFLVFPANRLIGIRVVGDDEDSQLRNFASKTDMFVEFVVLDLQGKLVDDVASVQFAVLSIESEWSANRQIVRKVKVWQEQEVKLQPTMSHFGFAISGTTVLKVPFKYTQFFVSARVIDSQGRVATCSRRCQSVTNVRNVQSVHYNTKVPVHLTLLNGVNPFHVGDAARVQVQTKAVPCRVVVLLSDPTSDSHTNMHDDIKTLEAQTSNRQPLSTPQMPAALSKWIHSFDMKSTTDEFEVPISARMFPHAELTVIVLPSSHVAHRKVQYCSVGYESIALRLSTDVYRLNVQARLLHSAAADDDSDSDSDSKNASSRTSGSGSNDENALVPQSDNVAQFTPGEKASLVIRVINHLTQLPESNAIVCAAVVDESILALARYDWKDPLAVFHGGFKPIAQEIATLSDNFESLFHVIKDDVGDGKDDDDDDSDDSGSNSSGDDDADDNDDTKKNCDSRGRNSSRRARGGKSSTSAGSFSRRGATENARAGLAPAAPAAPGTAADWGGGGGEPVSDRSSEVSLQLANDKHVKKSGCAGVPGGASYRGDSANAMSRGGFSDGATIGCDFEVKQVRIRENFDPVALWLPSVRTDEKGQCILPFQLPDSITQYRVMTFVSSQVHLFGSASASCVTRTPVVLRPSPPHHVYFGDRFQLQCILQNQTSATLSIVVVARASNLLLRSQAQRITLAPDQRAALEFAAETEGTGIARFQLAAFDAVTGRFFDATQGDLRVFRPVSSESFATSSSITTDDNTAIASCSIPFEYPDDVLTNFGELGVSVSSSALVQLRGAIVQLQNYPFECSEQLASRMQGVISARKMLALSEHELRRFVKTTMAKLQRLQDETAGFGFFGIFGHEWPYLTVHVAHTMALLEENGFDVPGHMKQSLAKYLDTLWRHVPFWYPSRIKWCIRAYGVYVQTLKAFSPNNVKSIAKEAVSLIAKFGGVAKTPAYALALVLPSIARVPVTDQTNRMQTVLRDAIAVFTSQLEQVSADKVYFVSNNLDLGSYLMLHSARVATAVILNCLLLVRIQLTANSPNHATTHRMKELTDDMSPKMVAWLLSKQRACGGWKNTHENAWVSVAMAQFYSVFEGVEPDLVATVYTNQHAVLQHQFQGRLARAQRTDVPCTFLYENKIDNVTVVRNGVGRLYYSLSFRYAPSDAYLPALDRGFAMTRSYHVISDKMDEDDCLVEPDENGELHFKQGDRIRISIICDTAHVRHHVAICDNAPAGFEVKNPKLDRDLSDLNQTQTKNTMMLSSLGGSLHSYSMFRQFAWDHINYRLKGAEAFAQIVPPGTYSLKYIAIAKTRGSFAAPPSKAEEMYDPDVFGRTESNRVIID
jgi:Bacterial Alpha-2-macroglobulin MG10 domain/Alpha-2-macroglobulin family/Bacterial Ig-like domain